MPLLDPNVPLQKSSEITKRLRSRDSGIDLCSLLPFAKSVLDGEANVVFPRKGEWVLEWAVQRLREEEDGRARTNPEFWALLGRVLKDVELAATARVLKRQGFLQMLLKALEDALRVFKNDIDDDRDVEMSETEVFSTPKESPMSPASSSTETGSPRRFERLSRFLREVSAVVRFLQASGKEAVVAVLRGPPEVGAGVLGGYLRLAGRMVDSVENEWTGVMVGIWRSCVWGKGEFKKLANVLATACIPAATTILANPNAPEHLKTVIEELLSEYIFLPDILFPTSKTKNSKPSAKELIPILEPLKSSATKYDIPKLFSVALAAYSQKSRSKLDVEVAETIFLAFTEGILGVVISSNTGVTEENANAITALLEALYAKGTSISPALLSSLIDLLSNLSSQSNPVRWGIIELALKLDFDTFLGPGKEYLATGLFSAISAAPDNSESVRGVLALLVEGYVKARDLEGFISHWREELRRVEGVWASDDTARVVAGLIEKSWLPGQIARILRNVVDGGEWIVVDALVRGLQREENIDAVREVLQAVVDALPRKRPEWREWRVVVRALQMDGIEIVGGLVEKAVEVVVAAQEYKEIVFAFEVVMAAAETDLESLEKVLAKCTQFMESTEKGWTGIIADIEGSNIGVVIGTSVAGRWLKTLENVKPDVRTRFVNAFVEMAVRGLYQQEEGALVGRDAWRMMLSDGESFEYVGLKDAVLAALIAQFRPYNTLSSELTSASLENISEKIQKPSAEELARYGFVLESMSYFPLEALKRSTREKILDSLLLLDKVLQRDDTGASDVPSKMLGVAEKLWGVGNASSFMASDINGLLLWFEGTGDRIPVGRSVLKHALSNKDQPKTQKFLNALIKNLLASFSNKYLSTGIIYLCVLVVTGFWKHREYKLINPSHEVETLKSELVHKLGNSIKTFENKKELSSIINAWSEVYELEHLDDNMTAEAKSLVGHVIGKFGSRLAAVLGPFGSREERSGVIAVTKLACACARIGEEALKATALAVAVVDSENVDSLRGTVLESYRTMLGRLTLEGYREVVEKVVESCFPADENVGEGYWEVLKVLIGNIEKPDDEDVAKQFGGFMSTVYSSLAMNLPRAVTESGFLAVADCMNAMLREKPWTIQQYNIDETLLSITLASSPRGPAFASNSQPGLFLHLTNLISSILTLHRRRIAGRYHLIISLFQSLLNCLHLPKPSRKKSEKPIHPPWLTVPLTIDSAVAYTRVLTTLCDPPTSSVTYFRSSSNQAELVNSATVAAKKAVGRHVGYILVGFVKMGLEHRMDAAVREELRRGWWAVFDILDREVLRALNAGLDAPGRAVLKTMFEEWVRFKDEKV